MSKEQRYSKEVLDAARRTIAAYDKAIAARSVKGWENYGCSRACRLCKAVLDEGGFSNCVLCPLSDDGRDESCLRDKNEDIEHSADELIDVTEAHGSGYTKYYVVKVLKARRAWLIKRLEQNGVKL
jgi:hypothetical protein